MNKILKALKHIFIPHQHNDYKPHFFREASVVSIAIVAVLLLSISIGTNLYIKNTNMIATVLPAVLVDLTNDARVSNNEKTLVRSSVLDNVARLKANDMARLGYFAHTSPSGVTPWYWFNEGGYSFVYAGENLAIDFTESVDVENAWLASPTHKANILNSNFSEIGVATVDATYQGRPTTYVVQMFGTPAFARNNDILNTESKKIIEINPKQITTPTTLPKVVAITPAVKGAEVSIDQKLETITETKEFVAVKNITSEEVVQTTKASETPHYSSWNERLMFMLPTYTDRIYRIFIWIVLIALISMTIIEIRYQHPKNIMYGVLLLVIIACLIYINKAMFTTSFFS